MPHTGAQGKRLALLQLCATPRSNDDLVDVLSKFFSEYGELRKISSFNVNGNGNYFLIDYACDAAAVKAANSTGCCMFGFNTLLLKLDDASKAA